MTDVPDHALDWSLLLQATAQLNAAETMTATLQALMLAAPAAAEEPAPKGTDSPADAKAATAEARPAEPKPGDARITESKPDPTKTPDPKSADAKAAETKAADPSPTASRISRRFFIALFDLVDFVELAPHLILYRSVAGPLVISTL